MSMTVSLIDERHFIEDIGLYFEQLGLPRMAGRILGVLLISDPPEQSTNDLCEILQASKSSISTTTRLLLGRGLIERVASPLPRRDYYQFKPEGWRHFLKQHIDLWRSLHQIAEAGLELVKDKEPPLRERLQEAHDIFSFMEDEIPALMTRWEEDRSRPSKDRKKKG